MSNWLGKLYNLKNNDGGYYADSILRQRGINDALEKNKLWNTFEGLTEDEQLSFLKNGGYKSLGAYQEKLVGPKGLKNIENAVTGQREALIKDGAWAPENRDMSKQIMKDWVGEHKLKTLGYGLGGAMNVAGLTDNDKFGGQIGGAALGGALGYMGMLPGGISAPAAAMAGGAIGSLFDKLRAKREQEAQYQNQYR